MLPSSFQTLFEKVQSLTDDIDHQQSIKQCNKNTTKEEKTILNKINSAIGVRLANSQP
jgi:hypothetical protein